MSDSGPIDDLSGDKLGRYEIKSIIGKGGMGEVYAAFDTLLKRDVALKRVLQHSNIPFNENKSRFLAEARAVSALTHPNIAVLYDIFETNGELFLVMELLKGTSLRQKVGQPFTFEQFVNIAVQCAEALQAAHQNGVLHRDLKPENVFLVSGDHIKILDFGLAYRFAVSDAVTLTRSDLKSSGTLHGTLLYLPPEALKGGAADQRRDLFALGLVFYELLTAQHPFSGDSIASIAARIIGESPPPPSQKKPGIPPGVDRIVLRLIEKEPALRYQNATELLNDLRILQRSESHPTPLAQVTRPGWLHRTAILISLFVVAITLFGLFLSRRSDDSTDNVQRGAMILITDFEDATARKVFGQSLREGLTISLQQSRYLTVFPRQRLFDALQRMKKTNVQVIDENLGREICLREDIQVLLTGSIRQSGDRFQVLVQAQDPSGKMLFAERETFAKPEEIFDMADTLSRAIRKNLGESSRNINRSTRSLAKVTTGSLKALEQYSKAADAFAKGDLDAARTFLQTALNMDSNFAMAHRLLSSVYLAMGDRNKQQDHLKQAFRLRDGLTDREQYFIEASYYEAQGQEDKSLESLKLLVSLYPDDAEAHRQIAFAYREMGNLEKTTIELREVLRLDRHSAAAYGDMILLLARTNQENEAFNVYKRATQYQIQTPRLEWGLGMALLGTDKIADAHLQFKKLQNEGGVYNLIGRIFDARAFMYEGKLKRAIQELNETLLQTKIESPSANLLSHYLLSRIYRLLNHNKSAKSELEQMLPKSGIATMEAEDLRRIGSLYAQMGEISTAESLLKNLDRVATEAPTPFNRSCVLLLEGEIAMAKRDYQKALNAFLRAQPLDPFFVSHQELARLYMETKNWEKAIDEWKLVLMAKGEILQDDFPPDWILAHREIAHACSELKQTAEAQKYLTLFQQRWHSVDLP